MRLWWTSAITAAQACCCFVCLLSLTISFQLSLRRDFSFNLISQHKVWDTFCFVFGFGFGVKSFQRQQKKKAIILRAKFFFFPSSLFNCRFAATTPDWAKGGPGRRPKCVSLLFQCVFIFSKFNFVFVVVLFFLFRKIIKVEKTECNLLLNHYWQGRV